MRVCLFLGPTLPAEEVRTRVDGVTILPPAEHGDVHAAVLRFEPRLVGLVDGVFLDRPSVWHKEILWALDRGVHVLGAASMGALRAVELEPFGMEGVGAVFRALRRAALPPFDGHGDDDEVALVHGPAESGYLAITEAMVNIRATLDVARSASVLDAAEAARLTEIAKSLHFTERTYRALLERGAREALPTATLERLDAWLPEGRVDRKREDALALLERLVEIRASGRVPSAGHRFEPTEHWLRTIGRGQPGRTVTAASDVAAASPDTEIGAVLDELRLDPELYVATVERALVRVPCAERSAHGPSREGIEERRTERARLRLVGERFRRANALWDRRDIDAWLEANALDTAGCDELLRREAEHRRTLARIDTAALGGAVIDLLRLDGRYHVLRDRARHKASVLARSAQPPLEPAALLRWYFEDVRGETIPDPDTFVVHRQTLGLEREHAFLAWLGREYRYRHALRAASEPAVDSEPAR